MCVCEREIVQLCICCMCLQILLFQLQTGPKGVVKDWREFKRLETERREENERERQAMAKKLTLTCRSHVRLIVNNWKKKDYSINVGVHQMGKV